MTLVQHPLASLICGNIDNTHREANIVFNRLSNTISNFSRKLLSLELIDEDDRELAPFYARNIIEGACSALLGRYDFFRLLSVYKVQSSSNYDITKRSNIALQWKGDILAATKPKEDMWNPENKLSDYDRALLGNHVGELLWKPGYLALTDFLSSHSMRKTDWVDKLEMKDENQFFEMSKTEAGKLFSAFSKGVHYEFLINSDSIYDATTVQDYVIRMVQLIAELGLVSHYSGILVNSLPKEDAIQYFQETEELIKRWHLRTD
ncbi:hypothetical protein [Paenibacillus macquariensis]|uniref:Uncharacterized protein n=1 Tax=Paenibacillus macquariensis TaxID=948756 RepID=A0ABY1KAD6_9BACL|nr:hypothetical protein [Paenibacillus macquariensis]MEC0093731.1 hypothetical protein [Paenibacillus macquariensis]OAB31677.1 hypothetical protein PMSM_19595 [Paenibacillus macquariensis subsp. macquariensis]SIR50268.1 hypothetical protein SAMN05421578_11658 [Paenibacillus macquariensis]